MPHPPTQVIRDAMARLDSRGRFASPDQPRIREAVSSLLRDGEVPDHPARLFGSWGDLAVPARAALRRLVESDIRRTMDLHPSGNGLAGLIRGGWVLDRYFHVTGSGRKVRRRVVRWTNRLAGGPDNARRRLGRVLSGFRMARDGPLNPGDVLSALDRGPQWLLGDFVEGVDVDPRARGFYHEPRRNVTWGYHVGLDLMPTDRGICCLEANLQGGIGETKGRVPGGNAIIEVVLDAALAQRARRVFWVEGHRVALPPWVLRGWPEEARRRGLRAEIFEDPCMPPRASLASGLKAPPRWPPLLRVPEDSLVLRRNEFPVGPDFVINDKEPVIRSLEGVVRRKNESRVFVVPMSRVPSVIPEPQGPGLPNLVYKYPASMSGKGVFFMRVRDGREAVSLARELDRKHGEGPGMFQPFVLSRLLDGGRVYDVRVEIFLSPLGTWPLALFRREGRHPLPASFPEGGVAATEVFASNWSLGGLAGEVPSDERRETLDAAFAVAEGLTEVLERTFRTRP